MTILMVNDGVLDNINVKLKQRSKVHISDVVKNLQSKKKLLTDYEEKFLEIVKKSNFFDSSELKKLYKEPVDKDT